MTKLIGLTLVLSLCSSSLFAHRDAAVTEEERLSAMASFGVGALLAIGLKKYSTTLGLSGAAHGVLQTANALWQLGSVSGNPVFTDLATRTLLAATSTAAAGTAMASQLVGNTPFIGDSLVAGKVYTHGLLTVVAYKALEKGMGQACRVLEGQNLRLGFCEGF